MKKFIYSLCFVFALCSTSVVSANPQAHIVDRVIAVVNDDVITQQELDKRFQYVLRQNKFNFTKKQQKVLYRKVLNDLINEEIKKQYASQHNIAVSKAEITLAIAQIEKQNKLSKGGFYNLISGIEETALAQVKTDLLWHKIIKRVISPRVIVSATEVDQLVKSLADNANSQEKELMQIFIPIDEDIKQAQSTIKDIYKHIKKKPEDYKKMATSYNKKSDGYLGWFSEGELAPALETSVKPLSKGDISEPIQSAMGFHIIKVLDMRETKKFETEPFTEYKLYEVSIKAPSKDKLSKLKDAKKSFETLGDLKEFILKNPLDLTLNAYGEKAWKKQADLPSWLAKDALHKKQFTSIFEQEDTLLFYYIEDERQQLPKELRAYKNRVMGRLTENRTNLMARRFMRDLRRRAFIEVRFSFQ